MSETRSTRWIEDFFADGRYAARMLAKRPGYTAVAVLTLALGIGGTTAVFSVVDALFLRAPEKLVDPGSLRRVYIVRDAGNIRTPTGGPGSWVDHTLMSEVPAFAGLAGLASPRLMDSGRGLDASQVRVDIVSGTYFGVLGVRPELGRVLAPHDDVEGGARVAVISHDLWQRRYGGVSDIVGRTLEVNGTPLEILGVAEEGFIGISPEPVEAWVPASMGAELGAGFEGWRDHTGMAAIHYVARLAPGAGDAAAAAQAAQALRATAEIDSGLDPDPSVRLTSLVPAAVPTGSRAADVALWLALVDLFVLLIACANVMNLLLARGITRRRELAVRLSIGAGRSRLVRQHLTETLVLAILGGGAGLLVARWSMGLMARFPLPPSAGEINLRLLLATLALTLLCALLVGVVPALRSTRVGIAGTLKDGHARGPTGRNRTRSALVATQVALSLTLLVGAGLFVRSLHEAVSIDPGLHIDRLLTVDVNLSRAGFPPAEREQFYEDVQQRLRAMPGVENVGIVHFAPFAGFAMSVRWEVPGRKAPDGGEGPYINLAGAGWFGTAGTRVLRGREFHDSDQPGAEPVAVLNEAMARLVSDGGDAVGLCMPIGDQVGDGGCTRVVGVVETQRHRYLDEAEVPVIYLARAQDPQRISWGGPTLVVRTTGDSAEQAHLIRDAVQAMRADIPYVTVRPLGERIERDILPFQIAATLFTLFGALAIVLTAVGLYGLLAFFVVERTHEIGIRRTFGAPVDSVIAHVVWKGMAPVLAGLAIGVATAAIGAHLLRSLLFGVEARDPAVFAVAAVVIVGFGLAASIVPAIRAARVSPLAAVQQD